MKKIRIIKTPPGFAPLEIRAQWVGVEIPLATEEDIKQDSPSGARIGTANLDGYRVLRDKAITALHEAGRHEAVYFWDAFPLGRYLVFKKEVCEVV